MTRLQRLRLENLIVDFLIEHKGKHNSVSQKEIASFLTEQGFPMKSDSIHNIIRSIIVKRRVPICHSNAKGYFWAENQAEIQSAIDDLQHRISEIQIRIEILKNYILN